MKCQSNSRAGCKKVVDAASGCAGTSKCGESQAQRAVVETSNDRRQLQKGESQARRAVVQNIDNRQGETGKVNGCFTLLKRITGLKCVNSEIKSNVGSTT